MGGIDLLLNAADQVHSVSSTQMQNTLTSQIDKVSQNPMVRNVGQLNATVQAANNQADVAKSLRNKGISSKKVDGIAEAIVARLNGQELTRPKRNLLSSSLNSSAVRDTISELMKKKVGGIDSEQNRIYDRGDISDGLTDEEKAALWDLAYQRVGGDRSEGPGRLREFGSLPPEAFSAALRPDVFGDNDDTTVMEGPHPINPRMHLLRGTMGMAEMYLSLTIGMI